MTAWGPDYRHLGWRWPAYPRYLIYQVCNYVLGVRFGSDAAKRYELEGQKIRIFDKDVYKRQVLERPATAGRPFARPMTTTNPA